MRISRLVGFLAALATVGFMARAHAATVLVGGNALLQYQPSHDGITVEFVPGPSPAAYAQTTTDQDGAFQIEIQAPGAYTVRFTKAGYAPDSIYGLYLFTDSLLPLKTLAKNETHLQGGYTQTLSLGRTSSPYRVQLSINCDTLRIDPGVRLRFYSYSHITVNHELTAIGSIDDSIHVTLIEPKGSIDCSPPFTCQNGAGFSVQNRNVSMAYCRFDSVTSPYVVKRTWDALAFAASADTLELNACVTPFKVGATGTGHLIITDSYLDLLTADTTFTCEVDGSHVGLRPDGPVVLRGSADGSHFVQPYISSGPAPVQLDGQFENTTVEAGYYINARTGSALLACTLVTEDVTIRGTLEDSYVNTSFRLHFLGAGTIQRNTFHSYWVVETDADAFLHNQFCSERGMGAFSGDVLVQENTFDCDCPLPVRIPTPYAVAVSAGATFTRNVVALAIGNPTYGPSRSRGIEVSDGGIATNNIVVGRGHDTTSQVGVYARNDGFAINNLVLSCDTGVFAETFASVWNNDSWGNTVANYAGIPVIGVNAQLNTRGDSCDAFFNISEDPMVALGFDSPCAHVLTSCESPLMNAGDVSYGSPHIWLPADACIVTGVREQEHAPVPTEFSLYQNYPNPFNAATLIEFEVPFVSMVTLEVFNVLGQKVVTLYEGELTPGRYVTDWDGLASTGQQVASGVYLYRLRVGESAQTRKMVLAK